MRYQIDPNLPNQQRIYDAIEHWQEKLPHIRFSKLNEIPGHEDFIPTSEHVYFTTGPGCSSYIGKIGGRQEIMLSNLCSTGNVIHEIGHAVGLWHEHTRQDRDQTIVINWNNIQANTDYNFRKYTELGEDGFDHGNFDIQLVMMYGSYAFSRNGLPTITRLDGSTFTGQRVGLSEGDIAAVRIMYPVR